MQNHFDILKKSRQIILKITDKLSIEQLNKIPDGFNNNIVWNIAHLVVTQQLLCYKLAGLECAVSAEMIKKFQKGSSPSFNVSSEEFESIKSKFLQLPVKMEQDFANGLFKDYQAYDTSVQITLSSIDDGIVFNTYHEGIHLGIILQLLKLV